MRVGEPPGGPGIAFRHVEAHDPADLPFAQPGVCAKGVLDTVARIRGLRRKPDIGQSVDIVEIYSQAPSEPADRRERRRPLSMDEPRDGGVIDTRSLRELALRQLSDPELRS